MSYTTASLGNYSGDVCPSPDLGAGTGIDIAKTALGATGTMSALQTAMDGFYTRSLLKDSDAVSLNCEGLILTYVLDFNLQRLFSLYCVRLSTAGKIRLISRNSTELKTLSDALASVDYPVASAGIGDAVSTLAERQSLNQALFNAGVYMCVWGP